MKGARVPLGTTITELATGSILAQRKTAHTDEAWLFKICSIPPDRRETALQGTMVQPTECDMKLADRLWATAVPVSRIVRAHLHLPRSNAVVAVKRLRDLQHLHELGSVVDFAQPIQTKRCISSGIVELISGTTGKTSTMHIMPNSPTGSARALAGSSASITATAKTSGSPRSETETDLLLQP